MKIMIGNDIGQYFLLRKSVYDGFRCLARLSTVSRLSIFRFWNASTDLLERTLRGRRHYFKRVIFEKKPKSFREIFVFLQ